MGHKSRVEHNRAGEQPFIRVRLMAFLDDYGFSNLIKVRPPNNATKGLGSDNP